MSTQFIRYELYETKRDFFIIGQSVSGQEFSVLQLRANSLLNFTVTEVASSLNEREIERFMTIQQEIAKSDNDEFKQKGPSAWGLLGLIRFTHCYYLCMVTRCSVVALLGGNKIYHIDETKLVPLVHSSKYETPDRRSTEARLASTFHSLDLANTFYFSPTYDLSNTLQTNLSGEKAYAASIFVWNSHLLTPLTSKRSLDEDLITTNDGGAAVMEPELRRKWFLEIIHGFIDQARISIFGNSVYITLIARRSHQFAGARFYKRGVNNQGYPANEVETEQIVSNQLSSLFGERYTSYIQHRGSICVSWSQMSNNMSPQPPIRIDAMDPYYEAAAKHFNRMFMRYGYPIRVLNLVKTREKRPREGLLSHEFENCIRYLNQFLPTNRKTINKDLKTRSFFEPSAIADKENQKPKPKHTSSSSSSSKSLHLHGGVIEYTQWDMSRAAKSQSSEVIDYLERYANKTLKSTSIFQPGKSVQSGVCRTNCIDCLDRTNAAQSVIAKHALGYQLFALGITDRPRVDYDTDIMDLLTEMYHDHGDTLALQYGGSNLVNTVETYRRINQWSSHSRDLIERIRRFYSNSFMDAQRQDAINVFLGNYQYQEGFNLWDLSTDYYLHNSSHRETLKHSYRLWYEPQFLLPRADQIHGLTSKCRQQPFTVTHSHDYSSPRSMGYTKLVSLNQLFMSRINSTDKYSNQLSPFEIHAKSSKRTSQRKHQPESTKQELGAIDQSKLQIDHLDLYYTKYLHSAGSLVDEEEVKRVFEASTEPESYNYEWPETVWDDGTSMNEIYQQYLKV